jgi:hypothetical protein
MPKVRKLSGGAFMEEMAKAGVNLDRIARPRPANIRLDAMRPAVMPRGKGIGKKLYKGLKAVGKEAIAIAAPVIKEVARDMLKQKLEEYKDSRSASSGKGLYAARVGRGMKMSAAQIRTLKKGGAIQIKPSMMDEAGRYMMSLKPEAERMLDKALSRMKGMRIMPQHIESLMDMKRGGNIDFERLLRDTGKYLQPTADAAQDRLIREIKGSGKKGRGPFDFEGLLRDTGKYLQPTADAAQDRLIREIKGSGKKGRGPFDFERLLRDTGKYLQPTADAAQDRLIREIKGSGQNRLIREGSGRRQMIDYAGAGVIQLGSPYLDPKSAAADPFIPKKNPFT